MDKQAKDRILAGMTPEEREAFERMTPEEQEMMLSMALRMSAGDADKKAEKSENKAASWLFSKEEYNGPTEDDIAFVKAMLPDGSVKELFESESCLICNEEALPRDGYAICDMGHKEPEGTRRSVIGLKVKTKVGSIVPLQISCCKRCRRNHRIASFLSLFTTLIIVGLGIGIMAVPSVAAALYNINEAMSLIIFILLIPAGYFLGRLFALLFKRAMAKQTKFNVLEIPYIAKMAERGWFPLNINADKEPQLIFSKDRLKRGWFTE